MGNDKDNKNVFFTMRISKKDKTKLEYIANERGLSMTKLIMKMLDREEDLLKTEQLEKITEK